MDDGPEMLKTLSKAVAPQPDDKSSTQRPVREAESQAAMLDSMLSTAYPEHRSPRLAQFIFQVYHMTGSTTVANSLSHVGLGIGAKRFTRHPGPASQAG